MNKIHRFKLKQLYVKETGNEPFDEKGNICINYNKWLEDLYYEKSNENQKVSAF